MENRYSKFDPGHFYHIYNRSNGSEKLFREAKNYGFFLEKWDQYLKDWIDVWTYCLMPNHFHFLIKVRNQDILPKSSKNKDSTSEIISNQFRSLFISYTKSFNKVYDRHGSLFQKPFKHIHIDTQDYLLTLIHYIHHNPIHHNLGNDFSDWEYSSYSAITGKGNTNVKKLEVLIFFGGRKKFIDLHNQMKDYKKIKHLIIE